VDPSNSYVSVQESSSESAVTKSEEEKETYKPSKRHDLAMLFTCRVCETRSAKTMSRATYETGIVIVRCPKCRNLHLIADRLGWFGEPGSVEDFLQHQGVSVRKGLEASYEFSVVVLAGWRPPSNENKN
jgi:protein import protein ZIM17